MTKYECTICFKTFNNEDNVFEHLVEQHADYLMGEYVVEV